ANAAEAFGIGLEDYLASAGVCVIEWAEKIRAALPAENLWITFEHLGADARKIIFDPRGARYQELLRQLGTN
ncbi:MAG: tRNA (adenosine(37)-N6)-threonylcarbamoyltransferase complex ATPase subunit type 1 TsaE, partial [Chloroflexi bacterium]|nr:tRNA (adenosine(37)-N6)-threonylcarbamoyltransferase complex ATPase subunit type 1 TsaE [Chloroflexota bacterium]